MTRKNVFETLSRSRRTNAAVQDDKVRQNQGPAIADAQAAADAARNLPPVGASLRWWGEEDPPGNLLMLEDGRPLSVNDYPDLFYVLGYRFNIAGDTDGVFRLPDSRGRSGMGATSTQPVGNKRGSESQILVVGQLPAHSHPVSLSDYAHSHGGATGTDGEHNHGGSTGNISYHGHAAPQNDISGGGLRTVAGDSVGHNVLHDHSIATTLGHTHNIGTNTHSHTATVGSVGSGQAVDKLHPVIHCNYAIRVLP